MEIKNTTKNQADTAEQSTANVSTAAIEDHDVLSHATKVIELTRRLLGKKE